MKRGEVTHFPPWYQLPGGLIPHGWYVDSGMLVGSTMLLVRNQITSFDDPALQALWVSQAVKLKELYAK